MTQMEKKLELAKDRLAFLVEQTQFSPADMSLNTQTFTWHGRMDDIFEEHKVIAQEKKAQYEEALKVCTANPQSLIFSWEISSLIFKESWSESCRFKTGCSQ